MKKLMLVVLLGGFLFTSCQKDDLSSQADLEAVDGKGKNKIKDNDFVKVEEEGGTCVVNLFPDLPTTVDFCVTDKGTDVSYFDINITAGDLTGAFSAWCADQDASLNNGDCVTADVHSSYEDIVASNVIEFPENLPAVNWLINQNYLGQISGTGEAYTMGDIQRAIWALLDDSTCVVCEFLPDFDDARRDELVALALENTDFVPVEGDLIGIILKPQDGSQTIIVFIPVECKPEVTGGCETAFARDDSGNTCFDQYGFSRWGWTIGPITEGGYTYDVYAGAGQCDTSKGTLVGTVDVAYGGGTVDVTYNLVPGFNINAEHTYAGYAPIPTNPKNGMETVAPGQYTITENLEGEIYVILHTEVCGDYED
jgi:hypothetical protein